MKKNIAFALLALVAAGCARGKMGRVDQALETGVINKSTPIYVEPISAKDTKFSGDKSAHAPRVQEEKTAIETQYAQKIAEYLKKKGYNAQAVSQPQKKGVTVSGKVSRFEHGSAAARIMVGMGAGSSNMFTDLVVEDRDRNKVLSKFEVIATSGSRGGLTAAGSFMDAHLSDGAEKAANYIAGEKD